MYLHYVGVGFPLRKKEVILLVQLEKYTTKKDVIGAPISDNMEKPMEVYDLDMDLDEQLKPGTRVWNL